MSNYCYKLNAAASPPDAHLLYVGEAKFENIKEEICVK